MLVARQLVDDLRSGHPAVLGHRAVALARHDTVGQGAAPAADQPAVGIEL
jgi:hypothetical protein